MTAPAQSAPSRTSQLVFGYFSNQWAWRVEWRDASGRLKTKDFIQKNLRPGEAKEQAVTFRDALDAQLAA